MLPKTKRPKTIVCKIYPQSVGEPEKFNVFKPTEFVIVYIYLDDTYDTITLEVQEELFIKYHFT